MWVAVGTTTKKDWMQIGDGASRGPHAPGRSHVDKYGYPAWGSVSNSYLDFNHALVFKGDVDLDNYLGMSTRTTDEIKYNAAALPKKKTSEFMMKAYNYQPKLVASNKSCKDASKRIDFLLLVNKAMIGYNTKVIGGIDTTECKKQCLA